MARRGRRRGHKVAAAPGPYVPSLPLLGTTWYERGRAYWWRRVRASLAMFAILAIDLFLVGLSLNAIRDESRTGFVVVTVVVGVLGVVTGVLTWRRAGRIDTTGRVSSSDARLAGRTGAVLGTTARAGSVLSGLVLFVGSLILVGPLVALFVRGFDRELYVERKARATLGLDGDNGRTPDERARTTRA